MRAEKLVYWLRDACVSFRKCGAPGEQQKPQIPEPRGDGGSHGGKPTWVSHEVYLGIFGSEEL